MPSDKYLTHLWSDMKIWQSILNSEAENFAGDNLLGKLDTLKYLSSLVEVWTEIAVEIISRHESPSSLEDGRISIGSERGSVSTAKESFYVEEDGVDTTTERGSVSAEKEGRRNVSAEKEKKGSVSDEKEGRTISSAEKERRSVSAEKERRSVSAEKEGRGSTSAGSRGSTSVEKSVDAPTEKGSVSVEEEKEEGGTIAGQYKTMVQLKNAIDTKMALYEDRAAGENGER